MDDNRRALLAEHPRYGRLVEEVVIFAADRQNRRIGERDSQRGYDMRAEKSGRAGVEDAIVLRDGSGHFLRVNSVRTQQAKHFRMITNPALITARLLLCIDSPSLRLA